MPYAVNLGTAADTDDADETHFGTVAKIGVIGGSNWGVVRKVSY